MSKRYVCILMIVVVAMYAVPVAADDYALFWSANTFGGERMVGGNHVAIVSLGQLTIGAIASGQWMAGLGVWSGELPSPKIVASPGEAKCEYDNTRLALADLVVTTEPGSFPNRIYAEAPDRSSGIALVGGGGEAALTLEGYRVNVVGGVSTLNGERIMLNPIVAVLGHGDPLPEVWMINRSVGGTDLGAPPCQRGVLGGFGLNNVGLLVRTGGVVIDNGYADYILINDGSKTPFWETGLRVAKTNLSSVPEVGSIVVVSGISGVSVRGSVLDAVVRPRKAGDMEILSSPTPGALQRTNVRREKR